MTPRAPGRANAPRGFSLDGATCLVTGANRGIGEALVRRLARRPVRVLAGMRNPSAATALGDGGRALEIRPVLMDLSSAATIEASCAALGDDLEYVDVLINNAGRLTSGLFEVQDVNDVYAMFQANLVGLVHLTRRVLPGMLSRGRGVIVDNTSISAFAHLPTATTYAASKAGVAAFTEALRRELAGTGVTCMTLITPAVETDMLRETDAGSGRYVDTSGWSRISADVWAERVVSGIEHGRRTVEGTGRVRALRVLSQGPPQLVDVIAARMFKRPRA